MTRPLATRIAALLCALSSPIAASHARASTCTPVHVRLDPSIWNTSRAADLGRSIGQTFLAEDTLISAIELRLPPGFPTGVSAHLYVTGVDEFGVPNTSDMLLDGPTVLPTVTDSAGFTIMPFVLDPPLELPHRGTYAFFVRTEHCSPGSWFIVASNLNPYPNGSYWLTGRIDSSPCGIREVSTGSFAVDLLFDIEFCSTQFTPVRAPTWGRIKVLYR